MFHDFEDFIVFQNFEVISRDITNFKIIHGISKYFQGFEFFKNISHDSKKFSIFENFNEFCKVKKNISKDLEEILSYFRE